ncbi:hypothetical protein GDO78_009305 [Eleutherodactylus coqui]|uniref:Uncharacterized protein n=1 Tax=Eleutherodactylus coqui TaxID=57060 RepID=A0A8J6K998_ELECQ|nr:hypothetical protein GDO78_009305 [Eleutherodactylus coqui]
MKDLYVAARGRGYFVERCISANKMQGFPHLHDTQKPRIAYLGSDASKTNHAWAQNTRKITTGNIVVIFSWWVTPTRSYEGNMYFRELCVPR